MAKRIDESQVRKVAKLSRLELTDAEVAEFTGQLSAILGYVEKMNELVRSPESRFDVHTVQCIDCHPKGVPPKRKDHPLAD